MAWTGRRDYPFADGMTNRGRLNQTIMPKKMTANKGASEVRHEIIRKMEELESLAGTYEWRWDKLITYIKGMTKRASAKRGGLGRK